MTQHHTNPLSTSSHHIHIQSNKPQQRAAFIQPQGAPQQQPQTALNNDLFILSRAYAQLKQKYEDLQHSHKCLLADFTELQHKEQQQKLILKAQREAHEKNLTLMLPGEQELIDMKERVKQLEHERDNELIPEIARLNAIHKDAIENHGSVQRSIENYEKKIQELHDELAHEKRKTSVTIAVQERANTTLRRKNAQLFSKLMNQKMALQDEKSNKFEDKNTIARMQAQLDRYQYWNDQFKGQMAEETKSLQQSKHKTLKLDAMLKHEWLNAREREKLIAELTDENLYLRHCNRVLQDQIDLPPKPLEKNIETLFYKNVQEQLRNMESYLGLTPVEGDEWTNDGNIQYLRNEKLRQQQHEDVERYLEEIGAFLSEKHGGGARRLLGNDFEGLREEYAEYSDRLEVERFVE